MKKAVITIGISASGKSTGAAEWVAEDDANRVEINRDEVRKNLYEATSNGKPFTWDKWKWAREGEVTTICEEKIRNAAEAGKDIIISDTNLNAGRRGGVERTLKAYGFETELLEFPVALEEAWKRDSARENGVGHSVIAKQYNEWLKHKGRKTYKADKTKPTCILFDLDGTMFHMNGKRGPFEWDKVDLDDVDEVVRSVVNHLPGHWKAIALSGRDGSCEALTRDALNKGGVIYDKLFMRAAGDMRKDTIVKEEIFWREIANNYNVRFVIDDRPCVVRLWQEIGLKTFAVGNQHIEF